MQRMVLASVTIALAAVSAAVVVPAQGQQPTFATTKVTDNVYSFRNRTARSCVERKPHLLRAILPLADAKRRKSETLNFHSKSDVYLTLCNATLSFYHS